MTQLVEDLLYLARSRTHAVTACADGASLETLRDVVNDAAQELHGLADARDIRIRVASGTE